MFLDYLILALVIIMIIILLRAARKFADIAPKYSKLPFLLSVFLGVWLIYLSVLSAQDVLYDFSMPPKMPLLVVLPLFILILISLGRRTTLDFVRSTSISWLIYLHGFRIIVELIIWGAYLRGIIPKETTFEGMNFDVWVGASAVPLAFLSSHGKVANKLLIVWNVLGLLVLGNTVRIFIISGFFPELLSLSAPALGIEFFKMPYLLIAGFLMPLAVFLHALSIKQLMWHEKHH